MNSSPDNQHFLGLFDSLLPSTIFQLCMNGSSWVEPVLMCLAQEHNTVMPVRLKPANSGSQVKHSTTEPLCSHILFVKRK